MRPRTMSRAVSGAGTAGRSSAGTCAWVATSWTSSRSIPGRRGAGRDRGRWRCTRATSACPRRPSTTASARIARRASACSIGDRRGTRLPRCRCGSTSSVLEPATRRHTAARGTLLAERRRVRHVWPGDPGRGERARARPRLGRHHADDGVVVEPERPADGTRPRRGSLATPSGGGRRPRPAGPSGRTRLHSAGPREAPVSRTTARVA